MGDQRPMSKWLGQSRPTLYSLVEVPVGMICPCTKPIELQGHSHQPWTASQETLTLFDVNREPALLLQVVPSLAIHDCMNHMDSTCATVGFGGCLGMSGFLLAVGAKVMRS